MRIKEKYLVALIIISISIPLLFVVSNGFTTIENAPTVISPTFTWQYFDSDGTQISDISTAVISGTVSFKATLTNSPTRDIQSVVLRIYYLDNTLFNTYTFSQAGTVYLLSLDTTQIPDGDYIFNFAFIPVGIGGGGVPAFSTIQSFSVNLNDGSGDISLFPIEIESTLLMVAGISLFTIAIIGLIIYKRR